MRYHSSSRQAKSKSQAIHNSRYQELKKQKEQIVHFDIDETNDRLDFNSNEEFLQYFVL